MQMQEPISGGFYVRSDCCQTQFFPFKWGRSPIREKGGEQFLGIWQQSLHAPQFADRPAFLARPIATVFKINFDATILNKNRHRPISQANATFTIFIILVRSLGGLDDAVVVHLF